MAALLLAMCTVTHAAKWTATDQPALAEAIRNAKPLATEEVCVPVKTVRKGALMWVPNPDGKTYDVLQWYFKG